MTLNGNIINDKYYTLVKGSTVFTYKPLEALQPGTYTIGFHYNDGMHIDGKIIVESKSDPRYVVPDTSVR